MKVKDLKVLAGKRKDLKLNTGSNPQLISCESSVYP